MAKKEENKEELKIPSVLNFAGSIVPSNGLFTCVGNNQEESPLLIDTQTQRGTISNYGNVHKAKGEANVEKALNPENANIQKIDVCYLPNTADIFNLTFSVKFLNNSSCPGACNARQFKELLANFYSAYKAKNGFQALAKLYLKQIVNARWFWRNRDNSIDRVVKIEVGDQKYGFSVPRLLDDPLPTENQENFDSLAGQIAKALSGESEPLTLNVFGTGTLGFGQPAFPSQQFIENKKGKFLAYAECAEGKQAKMHSQKIGNAIRTIDTWYPEHEENPNPAKEPAPIEPYGVLQRESVATRLPGKGKSDLYSHLENLAGLIETMQGGFNNDHHYVRACMIRGGVFSGAGK
ncbi:MAG: type I-F CRISPR-associated protein Csy3 [Desulfobacula sp.]|jgi:CRISPR-associated protein Csy3|nr:type I-F CRISPR-associated protein Csy3 [Desulfobacula sp.]